MSLKTVLSDVCTKVGEFALDLLYPKKCVVCNSFVNYGKRISLCSACNVRLNRYSGVIRKEGSYFEEVVYSFKYDGNIKEAMTDTKFRNLKYLSETFGYGIYNAVKNRDFVNKVSAICYVPLNPMRERDYNQSYMIAKTVSEYISIPIYDDILIKPVNLAPLSKMDYRKRDYMIKNAFSYNTKYDISGKSICLIDDIYTTGSTVNECAKILKLWGADKVYVLTACYAERKERSKPENADSDIANQ